MAESELGKAVVPIRAELGELDKDLGEARAQIEDVLGKVGKGIAGVAGGILAGGLAAGAVLGKLATDAAPLEGVQQGFQAVADDADAMLSALHEGSMGLVTDAALMQSYNEAALLVSKTFADDLPGAMGPLSQIALVTKDDMGFMLDSLVKGVGRLSPAILDNLKIQVTLADATAAAAEMFGVEEEALTKAQVQAGLMAVATEALEERAAALPDMTDNASVSMQQFLVTMENLKNQAGMALLPVLKAVLEPLGALATEYGPQVAEVFGRLAELLGPLVGEALATLTPLVMQLLDAIIPLAESLLEMLFPAFSAILTAVVQVAGALIEALAPVLEKVLAAILPVAVALIEMLAPILADLVSRLLPVLAPLIVMLAETFARLLIAVMPLVETLLVQLLPIFMELIEILLPPLTDLLVVLVDIFIKWIEGVLPVLIELLETVLPILGSLATLIAEGLAIALEALAGIIETVVTPVMKFWRDKIIQPILELLDRMKKAVQGVVDWFGNLKDEIGKLDLPGWLTPGSPTPLELGLVGIADQLERVSGLMGGMNAQMSVQAVSGAGAGGTWNGNIIINGAGNPEATAAAVMRVMRDRGMITGTTLR